MTNVDRLDLMLLRLKEILESPDALKCEATAKEALDIANRMLKRVREIVQEKEE